MVNPYAGLMKKALELPKEKWEKAFVSIREICV